MKLHDLRPADGSRTERTRVGRGIAAGKGKTAGRGTKGQKARSGGSIPPWFEGGQTPLHVRIPKLRGFKNRLKLHYEVVNIGDIGAAAERGAFETEAPTARGKGKSGTAQITINQDILRAVGLVRTLDKPLKVLGAGELGSPLFVVADAFSASARAKIEAAGGSVNVLEVPTRSTPALGVDTHADDGSHADSETHDDRDTRADEASTAAQKKSKAPRAQKQAPLAEAVPAADEEAPAEAAPAETAAQPAAAEDDEAPAEETADTTGDDAESSSGDDV
jgi:large subunit ribosomal protein L15